MKKRILSVLLTLCMVLALLPVTAWAAEGDVCTATSCEHVAAIGEKHYSTLEAAVNAAKSGETVMLLSEVTLSNILHFNTGNSITLNLNGNDITTSKYILISHGSLNVTGTGTVTCTDASNYTFKLMGSQADVANYSVLTIGENVTVKCLQSKTGYGAMISFVDAAVGNDRDYFYGAKIIVNGTIESADSALYINGTISNETGNVPEIEIGSTAKITSTNSSVYLAGYGKTTVADGAQITAGTNVFNVAAGELTINGGTFVGGDTTGTTGSVGGSITTTTSTALYIKQHTTAKAIKVTVNGGDFKAYYAVRQEVNEDAKKAEQKNPSLINVQLKGGSFTSTSNEAAVYKADSEAKISISGGTFSTDPTAYVAPGYKVAQVGSTYSVGTSHTVTVDADNGTAATKQTVEYGGTAVQPETPTKEGYTFAGWYSNGAAFDFGTQILADTALTAQWTINQYTVTFDSNGGSTVEAKKVDYLGNVVAPEAPTRSGYTFNAWYNGEEEFDFDTPITEDITLTAQYDLVLSASAITTTPSGSSSSSGSNSNTNSGSNTADDTADDTTSAEIGTETGDIANTQVGEAEEPAVEVVSVTTVTDEETGTVTTTTEKSDGSTTVVEEQTDGTVTTTDTTAEGAVKSVEEKPDGTITTTDTAVNGVEAVTVEAPGQQITAVITIPETVESAVVTIPVSGELTAGMVAMDADTGEIIMLSALTEDGLALKLDGSKNIVIVDNSKDFEDVPENNWVTDGVDYATAHNLFGGTSETTFDPDGDMTRTMLMTVLARFEGIDTAAGNTWDEIGMNWAIEQGITDGSDPNGSITREQLATMLYRYAGSPKVDGAASGFTDSHEISSYAADAMAWAVQTGILTGNTRGELNPTDTATRGQVATMMMRFGQGQVQ